MPVICQSCESVIIEENDAGYCANCVLQAGLELLVENRPLIDEWQLRLERFDIIEVLGTNMALVFRVLDKAADRICVLKLLIQSEAPGFLKRFEREAQALKSLKHPNIVELIETGEIDGVPFILMEDGGENLKHTEYAATRSVVEIMLQVCDAISHAHASGFVHRDIKPENILVAADDAVRITDFGITKITSNERQAITETGDLLGTAYYMAPEQFTEGLKADYRVDVYGLGAVLYELLTGSLPIDIHGQRQLNLLDRRMRKIIRLAVDPNPDYRWQSVEVLRKRLKRWLAADQVCQKLFLKKPNWRSVMKLFAVTAVSGLMFAALQPGNKLTSTAFDKLVVNELTVRGKVVVVDENGKECVTITTDGGTVLTLSSATNKATVEMGVLGLGGGFSCEIGDVEASMAVTGADDGGIGVIQTKNEGLAAMLISSTREDSSQAGLRVQDDKVGGVQDGARIIATAVRDDDSRPKSAGILIKDRYGETKFNQSTK